MSAKKTILVRTYSGSEESAAARFQRDAGQMAAEGYYPTSQSWAPGTYGCGSFLVALLLCFVFIGFIIFIYMLLVKPPGTLSITYELRHQTLAGDFKTCPTCAESIRAAATACRFCSHSFVAP